jgi:RNA polymerase primary sigma factor
MRRVEEVRRKKRRGGQKAPAELDQHGLLAAEGDFAPAPEGEFEGTFTPGEEDSAGPSNDNLSADDALGLYLQQMGSIPMLNREAETELAGRLERARARYRRAALSSWTVLARLVETFERTRAGGLALDRVIDAVPSRGLTAEAVAARLPRSLEALRALRREASQSPAPDGRARRRALRRAVQLAEGLSPRTELLDLWAEGLKSSPVSPADAEELRRLLPVLQRRRRAYLRARRELAEANLRLVVSVAKRYRGRGLPFADLIQEGNGGLMRAVDKFDHRLGYKFGTYATWWIRQGITRALSELSRTVRVPCHHVALLRQIERVTRELTVDKGREPTLQEVATALNITPEQTYSLRAAGRQTVSLDEPRGEGEGPGLEGYLSDTRGEGAGEDHDQRLLKERIDAALDTLAPRDRLVLELRFGLRDGQPRSLEEIAQQFGLTRERIRQIESRGLLKLREPDRRGLLSEFVARG